MIAADILIDDLADPRITPAIAAAREGPAGFDADIDADGILAAARTATGLRDYGDEAPLRDRLAVLVQALREDEGLTRGGRITILDHAIRVMANRLRIEDLVARHPEILDVPIERPIIIAGLPRSGTTHLVNWLARDTRLNALTLWESEEPVPAAVPPVEGPDPREQRSAEFWGHFEAMLPHMPAMHGMDAASIHEDNELLYMDLGCYSWEFQTRIPRWIDDYFARDRTGSYLYEKKVLQVLGWYRRRAGRGDGRWLLKSPQHMENLGPLKTAFPDATLIVTHRDPVAVLRSLTTMLGYGDRIRRDPTDPPGLARHWADRIERLLRACIAERDRWGPDQSLDLLFHEYMADQEGVMRRVYDLAGLDLTPETEKSLLGYLSENPRNLHGRIHYDLEGVFGVDVPALRERFAFYYDRFPVARED